MPDGLANTGGDDGTGDVVNSVRDDELVVGASAFTEIRAGTAEVIGDGRSTPLSDEAVGIRACLRN